MNQSTAKTEIAMTPEVAEAFASYPQEMSAGLVNLRRLIFETAAEHNVGELEETLKWGEPSYLTPKTKSGSTIRLAWKAAKPDKYSIFFKCTANLVLAMKEQYPDTFAYGGKRSLDFGLDDEVPEQELKSCIALALTYHRNKNLEPAARWQMVESTP